jgi:hypothetical protein
MVKNFLAMTTNFHTVRRFSYFFHAIALACADICLQFKINLLNFRAITISPENPDIIGVFLFEG